MIDFELPRVAEVRYEGGHVLWLRFDDGVEGRVDLGGHLRGPMFEPLREPERFAEVYLADGYTVAWPNGADLAPEFLYERLMPTGRGIARKRLDARSLDADAAADQAQFGGMPEISRFFGIIIRMFYQEREAPHFHAVYGDYVAAIGIGDGHVTTRHFPGRALRLVLDWRELHERDLLDNWERLQQGLPAVPIPPLD
jgi:hypothetical protein